jgi:hypothetical protein
MILRDCTLMDIMHVACNLRSDEWEQIQKFGGAHDIDAVVVHAMALPGPRWAYADESNPNLALMVGGCAPVRKGVYQSWCLVSKLAWKTHGHAVTEAVAERVQFMLDSGAHRIETLCLASRANAQRWYTTIGLRFESTLKSFCVDGSDAVMYVATRGSADVL